MHFGRTRKSKSQVVRDVSASNASQLTLCLLTTLLGPPMMRACFKAMFCSELMCAESIKAELK